MFLNLSILNKAIVSSLISSLISSLATRIDELTPYKEGCYNRSSGSKWQRDASVVPPLLHYYYYINPTFGIYK